MLPSGYQEVEYLIFSNSYIKTGVMTSNDTELTITWSTTAASTLLVGGRTDTGSNAIAFGYFGNGSSFVGFGGPTTNFSTAVNPMDGKKHTCVLSRTVYTIDGANQSINRGTFSNYYELFLGTWNNNGTPDSRYFVGNVYEMTIKKSGNLVMHLVPCYRKSDNVAGMYDEVSGKFMPSVGSGSFGKGPAVVHNNVTYKTVIHDAIKGFNDIQSTLSNLSIDLNVPTPEAASAASICTVTQLVEATQKLSTIKKSDGTFITGKIPLYDPTTDSGTKK